MASNSTHTDSPIVASPIERKQTLNEIDTDEAKFIELRGHWERQMRHFSPKKKHSKVEVLLLYWEKLSESYLDTEKEIDDLEEVFQQEYNFNVTRRVLNPPDNKDVTLRIQMFLANFVFEHDADDALLIIYYAGHGNPGKDGGLMLRGNNRPNDQGQSEIDEVAWKNAEWIIEAAKKPDVLLIFDCCFAGKLVGSSSRKAVSTRNFEFLGASGANETTISPGERSFTHALIKALKALSQDRDGFTTTELYLKILECPTFPKDEQTPCHGSRTNCYERLLLAPLDSSDAMSSSTASLSQDNPQSPTIQYCLTVDFLLTSLPTEHDLTKLCNSLKTLAIKNGLPAKKFLWNNMYRKGEEIPLAAKLAALRWRAQTLRNGSRPNQSSSIEEPRNQTANLMHLGERPEPCVSTEIRHEKLQGMEGFTTTRATDNETQRIPARRRCPTRRWITSGVILAVILLCWVSDIFLRFDGVDKVKAGW